MPKNRKEYGDSFHPNADQEPELIIVEIPAEEQHICPKCALLEVCTIRHQLRTLSDTYGLKPVLLSCNYYRPNT